MPLVWYMLFESLVLRVGDNATKSAFLMGLSIAPLEMITGPLEMAYFTGREFPVLVCILPLAIFYFMWW